MRYLESKNASYPNIQASSHFLCLHSPKFVSDLVINLELYDTAEIQVNLVIMLSLGSMDTDHVISEAVYYNEITYSRHMSRLMGKQTICIGENKGADQIRGYREADLRLCFRYSDSTIPPLRNSKFQASNLLL